jgi:Holliday junction resolvase RusA-like endonuclease
MIKTNIKMRVTPEQSKKVQEICFENGIYWAGENKNKVRVYSNFLYIRGLITHDSLNNFTYFKEAKEEEIGADFFIKTNGTCGETYLAKYTSQPKNLESALKKIENLHIALNKKVDKNKNQALEITKLLKDKEEYKQLQYDYESLRLQSNKKIKDVQNYFKNILDALNKTIDLLEDRIKEKDTIISYLESKLK